MPLVKIQELVQDLVLYSTIDKPIPVSSRGLCSYR